MTDPFLGNDDERDDSTAPSGGESPETPRGAITVRRNVALAGTVGGLATILAIAFAVRAVGGGSTLDWLSLGVLCIVALGHLAALVDARAPLMVVDDHGVRVRDGARWQGVAWSDVECLEHLPRRSLLRDGHLLVVGYDDQQLLVPLTLATSVSGVPGGSLSDALAALAAGRTDVVEVVPGLDDPADPADTADTSGTDTSGTDTSGTTASGAADEAGDPDIPREDPRPPTGGVAGPPVEEQDRPDGPAPRAERRAEPLAGQDDTDTDEFTAVRDLPLSDDTAIRPGPAGAQAHSTPVPGRAPVLAARAEYPSSLARPERAERAATPAGAPGSAAGPEASDTMTVVLDELQVRPAAVPVIGPQLAAARQRLRLSVDQVSDRTRIRPHVIEAIEVDDFGPCGGDFYARGHLRTMARVLGVDAAGLVATYDETYADAPVDPRRVFESELATGVGGSIRGTRGGRNWSVLVGSVMAAVLVWSLAQLLMGGPTPVGDTPVLSQTGSGGIGGAKKAETVRLTLTAAGGGAKVLVRDGAGDIVFDGQLAFGQSSRLDLVPPVRIQSTDGSVTAALDGAKPAALGETGEEVSKTLVAP